MAKQFNPKIYGMMVCPECNGCGRIRSPANVKVCQNCGGFGYIREEGKSLDQNDKPVASGGQ